MIQAGRRTQAGKLEEEKTRSWTVNVGNGDQGNIIYIYTYYTHIYIYCIYIYIHIYIYTLPKSDIAPENGPSQKEKVVSQPPNSRGEVYTEIL